MEKGAIVQRDRETYSVSPHIAGGFCTPELLRKIADIAEKYGAKYVKLTGSQRIALMGVHEDDIDHIWAETGDSKKAIGPSMRSIKVCPGTLMCKRAVQDSTGLGLALDRAYYGQPAPAKFKMGVSGCPNCCSDSWMKDVGFFGSAKGFKVTVGEGRRSAPNWNRAGGRCIGGRSRQTRRKNTRALSQGR
ncbi:MAG TPA: NAD(P)/FAD-dependent oxidoreductase [Methanocellaceae archaeon]